MIASIEGKIIEVHQTTVLIQVGPVGYEVMLPAYCLSELSVKIGENIRLCTTQYYEGTPGGGNLIPRIIGFVTESERQFFDSYTSVKGMGIKKALKSLSIPIATIASAVENGDHKILMSLPGIGKRMAQQIIAQLQGKMATFAAEVSVATQTKGPFEQFQAEALEILIAWGEKRAEAIELIQKAKQKHPDVTTAEDLVPLVYKLKQGIEL